MSNDLDAEIIRLWGEKLSASQIGSVLCITKNAVIGRVNRMRKKGLDVESRAVAKASVARIPVPEPLEEEVEPESQVGIPFESLTLKTCKFVIDGDHPRYFRFCGEPVTSKSYCKTHHSLCYVRARPKRYRYTETVFVLKDRA